MIDYTSPISVYCGVKDNTGSIVTLAAFMRMGEEYKDRIIRYRAYKVRLADIKAALNKWTDYRSSLYDAISSQSNPLGGDDSDEVVAMRQELAAADDAIARLQRDIEVGEHAVEDMKQSFPSATLSGCFAPTRAKANLQRHSGFICIDIDDHYEWTDSDGNKLSCVQSLDGVDYILSQLPWVVYAAHSVGGKGFFALIPIGPIDDVHPHEWYFDCLKAEFERYHIVIDPACRDTTRLRILSWDEHPYRNFANVVPYTGTQAFVSRNERRRRAAEEERRMQEILARRTRYANSPFAADDPQADWNHLCLCCDEVQRRNVNIANFTNEVEYVVWVRWGMALASEYGEAGRPLFHQLSAPSPKYNQSDTDKKYDGFLRRQARSDAPSVKSIFHNLMLADICWWKLR